MRLKAREHTGGLALTLSLTLFALLVHGYHPYAEDGGVYLAGVERLLNPALFPAWTGFVTEHLRFSIFAPVVAGLVLATHLPLSLIVFVLYLLSLWSTLFAAWMLAERMSARIAAHIGAVTLLACWMTLPIAGSSIILADPYLTARSFSTPLVVLALALALDAVQGVRVRWMGCAAALLLAATLHPLMAAYGLAAVLLLACIGSSMAGLRRWGPPGLGLLALLVAALLQAHAPAESADYLQVVVTRYYWFLSRWQWYEQLGLIAPLALIALLVRWRGWGSTSAAPRARLAPAAILGRTANALGLIAFAVALLFCHESSHVHAVARLQPLRCFAIVYETLILLLGVWLGEVVLRNKPQRWAMLLCTLGGLMFFVQRQTYPASDHLELPGRTPANLWERAFVWARENTPRDAVFALDARYITRGPGEDAQCFRVIAQRSALPDYSKDGGEASISPWLTGDWVRGQTAQTGLEHASDAGRAAAIKPLGASWIVLERASPTAWICPYTNPAVKVCKVP